MLYIQLLPVEQARTLQAPMSGAIFHCAAPALKMKVLRIFMTLPIRLAAKGLMTLGKCTAIGSFMALYVLSKGLWSETVRRRMGQRTVL